MTPAGAKIKSWRENPCKYVYEEFKVTPDKWQEAVLNAFPSQDPKLMRISMQACAGPGKSTVMAWCGWNFLSCYGGVGEHPKGAAVSITGANLADNLWPELAKWQARSEYLTHAFTWTKSRVFANEHPETWFIAARSFAKTSNIEEIGRTLSGLHSDYVLYLIDESGDIPPAIIKSAEQGLATKPKFGKILQAGNPTSQSGMLNAAATTLSHLWHTIRVTGDPEDPNRSPRIDIEWAKEQIKTYGRDNPWVMAYILGLFPPTSINILMGPDDVAAAINRHLTEDKYSFSQRRLGIDVARFGDDRTVIFPRQGLASFMPVEMRNARTGDIAARVALAKNKWKSEMEFVDGTGGYGSGVIDSLLLAGHNPQEIHFSGKPNDKRYFNKRSEIWFEMTNWVKRGGALPDAPGLKKELTAPTYFFQNGKFRVEEKDQIKKRLQFSPDMADALALTFSWPDMPAADSLQGMVNANKQNKTASDWDPFDDERK